jgi:very-short-patch-repair endonuclease
MGGEWSKSAAYPHTSTTRERDRLLQRLAGRQHHLFTAAQLADLGFGRSVVRDRVAAGRWFRAPFAGVYSLVPPPLDRLRTIKAAALACGHRSLPSHWSAAEVLGIAEPPLLPVHITRPCGSGVRRANLVVHRSFVPPCDTTGRDGILCTSAARTIADLAATTEPEELERILIAADSLRIVNHRRLEELAAERRGAKALRSLLSDDPIVVRSGRETELLQAFRRAGLPEPIVNGVVEGYEVDYHWPEPRLVVELDGWRFHGGRMRMNTDRERDQVLALAGWRIIRFTRDQVVVDPDECARRIAAIAYL